MALKKCSECGKEISTEAKDCPHCGKPQRKKTRWGLLISIGLILLVLFMWVASMQPPTTQSMPVIGSDPKIATDAQIYREFEICMNEAKKTVGDNKLEGQAIAARCMMGLKKYGDMRAKKVFNLYFDLK